MQALMALVERHLGRQFVEAAQWLRDLDATSVAAIEAALYAGNIQEVVRQVESAALKFAAEANASYVQAGRRVAQWIDDQPQLRDRLIRFDVENPRVVEHARQNRLTLVRDLTSDVRENIRDVMASSTERNPRAWARDIRDGLGLTPQQSRAVQNYRRALERQDWTRALGYELSDGRADRSVAALQRNGGSLPRERIDQMVEQYRQNQITWRAEAIARTESSRNVHAAQEETFRQAIERGDLEPEDLESEWHPGPVTRHARRDHRSEFLLEQRPKLGESFKMPNGMMMAYPGDPAGGASNTIHCRCTRSLTLGAGRYDDAQGAAPTGRPSSAGDDDWYAPAKANDDDPPF